MSRSLSALGSVAALIAFATGCSSYWSASAGSDPLALALDADGVATWNVRLSLDGDGRHGLPCDLLSWELLVEPAEGAMGVVGYEVYLGDDSTPTEHGGATLDHGAFSVASFVGWTETADDRCLADATLVISTVDGAVADLVLRANAQDQGAGPDDEPKGDVALTLAVASVEAR